MSYIKNNIYNIILVITGVAFLLFCLPFFNWILLAAIFAFTLIPFKNKILINKYKFNKTVSVYLILIGLVVLILPFIFSLISFFSAGRNFSQDFKEQTSIQSIDSLVDKIYLKLPKMQKLVKKTDVKKYVKRGTEKLVEPTLNVISNFFMGLPMFFMGLFFFSASLFYFISDSKKIYEFVSGLKFFEDRELNKIISIIQLSCQSTLFATIMTGVAQALILSITAISVGLDYFFTLFFLTFFLAQIPLIGVAPVTVGLLIYAYAQDNFFALILVIIAGLLASVIDNIIRAWILNKYDSLHPLAGLIAAIGGLIILGPIGVLLGPVITLVFAKVLTEKYEIAKN